MKKRTRAVILCLLTVSLLSTCFIAPAVSVEAETTDTTEDSAISEGQEKKQNEKYDPYDRKRLQPEGYGYNVYGYNARPSTSGKLHVEGTGIVDEHGRKVTLHGVSTHGLTWFPKFVNGDLFKYVSDEWGANLIRLAMYSEVFCSSEEEKTKSIEIMEKGIQYALENDLYVIVDWHVLRDSNPNTNIHQAEQFFSYITAKYGNNPAIIYEICNEPNTSTTWMDIRKYANEVIPLIRMNAPDSLIVCGTPDYDRNVAAPLTAPLEFDNVMYALHFYAATHKSGLRTDMMNALRQGLPIFVTECGLSEDSGDGDLDYASAFDWFRFLNGNGVSYAVWSFSNKDETSAMFKPTYEPPDIPKNSDLTDNGQWVRQVISGVDPAYIKVDTAVKKKTWYIKAHSWILKSLGERNVRTILSWNLFAIIAVAFMLIAAVVSRIMSAKSDNPNYTYADILKAGAGDYKPVSSGIRGAFGGALIILCIFFNIIYFAWRIIYTVPVEFGAVAITSNIILIIVELIGFGESLILYYGLKRKKNYPVPHIEDEQYPDVDIFIASYNEPAELLTKTINGCLHMKYPDKNKVHIWLCDDNRRAHIRELCEKMGIGYFDRPDNKGAKAGNLNHALGLTSAPYVVTLDADMIPKSDFLLKTIPYFVDAELRMENVRNYEKLHLGFLQTPQSFYTPDVFQHALYSEHRAPNEQDFFYRTIEVAKTETNSVIYGGSNTVLSRKALEDIGGFYTGSITEDFATGFLLEQKGYISLAISEPLASGQAPYEYKDHIKQRIRWGRGVIATAKQLHILKSPDMSIGQKLSYLSSVSYWYSSIKNLIYLLAPLLFAVFAVPVLKCNWLELVVFWLPVFISQDICLRVLSNHTVCLKWSGIYETGVMPHMLFPILQETIGISLSSFKVTDKSGKPHKKSRDIKSMIPFLILAMLTVAGMIRVITLFNKLQVIGLLILMYWLLRNLYFMLMGIFLVNGRDSDNENVTVIDAESVTVTVSHGELKGSVFSGVTTRMNDHNVSVFLDETEGLTIGTSVDFTIETMDYEASFKGIIVSMKGSSENGPVTYGIEILDYQGNELEFDQILYDRVPSLPQSLTRDSGIISHMWRNIAHRMARVGL